MKWNAQLEIPKIPKAVEPKAIACFHQGAEPSIIETDDLFTPQKGFGEWLNHFTVVLVWDALPKSRGRCVHKDGIGMLPPICDPKSRPSYRR